MFEFIENLEIEWDKVGWAFILWAACLLVLWKMMADPTFMKLYIKIILSIVSLPMTYWLLIVIGNR